MTTGESPAMPGGWIQVYVQLLNEGTLVYRPTRGTIVGPLVVRLEATPDYDPDDEEWEFLPGSTVAIETLMLSEGAHLVATRRIS